jgi:hypothetical protein
MQTKMYDKQISETMEKPSTSDQINHRLMLTIHQDGLIDILAGLIIATFGMIPILDATGLNPGVRQVIFLSCYMVEVAGLLWIKRVITLPRTGMVILSRRTTTRLSVTMLIINCLIFLVFAGTYVLKLPVRDFLGSYQLSVSLGFIFFVLFSATGLLLKALRYYLALGSFLFAEYLFLHGKAAEHGIPLASFFSGGVIVFSGILLLIRFLKLYRIENE